MFIVKDPEVFATTVIPQFCEYLNYLYDMEGRCRGSNTVSSCSSVVVYFSQCPSLAFVLLACLPAYCNTNHKQFF